MNSFHLLRHAALSAFALFALIPTAAAENTAFSAALDSITATELYEHVDVLADDTLEGRAAGSRGGQAAARYIETRLRKIGATPAGENGRFTQLFYGSYRNLLARVDGSDERLNQEYLVVGAHFDHVGYGTAQTSYGPLGYIHNGADDNASGVAVLLETIEAIKKLPQPPRRTIVFAFWDGEEQGLLGSKHWVRRPTVPLSAVRLAINIDMVGRMRDGRLELSGSRSGYGMRSLLASRSLPSGLWLHYDWELRENSDHWSFFERGIPVALLHTGLHDDYHRPSDDVERINKQGMHRAAAYLFDLVHRAANAEALPAFRSHAGSESPSTRRVAERPLDPLPPRLGITFKDDPFWSTADLPGAPPAPPEPGIVVLTVAPRSAAAAAGLKTGDRIELVNGAPFADADRFLQLVQAQPAESTLLVRRDGVSEPLHLDVRLAGTPLRLGIAWREDPAEPDSVYLVRVVPGSSAAAADLRVHDRIYHVNSQPFRGRNGFTVLLNERLDRNEPLTLTIERHGRIWDTTVRLP